MEFDKKGILGRAKAAQQSTVVMDEGLRAYMLKVYNYMATGILLTGIVALITFKMSVVTNEAGSIVGLTQMGNAIYMSGLKWLVDGDVVLITGDPVAFGVVWQQGILYINRLTMAVDWKPINSVSTLRSYRMKKT